MFPFVAREIYLNPRRTVEQKRLLLSHIFSNPKINGKNVEISYQKPFQMILNTVSEAISDQSTDKNTFEPPKEPVNKGKTPAFADVHPIWLNYKDKFRTYDWSKAFPDPDLVIRDVQQLVSLI